MTSSLLIFTLAALANLGLTPLFIRLAQKSGMMDHPGHRKIHTTPVAKLGGVSIVFSILAAVIAGLLLSGDGLQFDPQRQSKIAILLIFTCGAAFLGFIDDLYDLRPRYKLLLQAILFGAFTLFGFRFECLHLPGMATYDLHGLAIPLTLFWLLAVVNGFNFMDGIDGLAGTVTSLCLLSIGATNVLLNGWSHPGIIWPAALGAVLVFLAFNWKPAKIYLGDSGTSALGALVAMSLVSMGQPLPTFLSAPDQGLLPTEPFRFQLITVTLIAGYPAFEVTLSFLRRFVKRFAFGRSMEFSEKEHIHHRLLKAGFSTQTICRMAAVFQLVLAAAGLLAMQKQNAFASFLLVPFIMALTYYLPHWDFFDYLGVKALLRQPHFRIANYYISIQRIKIGLAHNREEILALVSQTCWELGVKTYRVKIKEDKNGKGGLDYSGKGSDLPALHSVGLWAYGAVDNEAKEFYDFIELPDNRAEALWIFDSHTSDDELDVEYRVLMNSFMRLSLETCVKLGSGRDSLDIPSVAQLPHDITRGHRLRKRSHHESEHPDP